MAKHNELGKLGEEIAVHYLIGEGYEIVERNWHNTHKEIDIIAKKGKELVIVEVKTRRNRLFGSPEEAIDYKKRLSLLSAINHYVKSHHVKSPVRFDVISIVGTIGSTPEIDHIKDVTLN